MTPPPPQPSASPTFLLSFDCEGKWGFADHLSPHYQRLLNHAALADIYRRLLDCLEKHGVRASFAFVGAFTLSPGQAAEHADWFADVPVQGRSWLQRFRADWAKQNTEGWFEPGLLQSVRQRPQHEIACHGFSHLPLATTLVERAAARRELGAARALAQLHGLPMQTLVYPRNLCGYTGDLADFGFTGYRLGHQRLPGRRQRLAALLKECWPGLRAEAHAATQTPPIAIPGGRFLNWRHGPRRQVPLALTRQRWRHALDDAIQHGGVVHLYSHPHNFLDGDQQLPLLAWILARVAERVQSGALANPTLADYCRQRLARTA